MKYMIASDIHGSYYYCEKMMEAYKQENAQQLILLGDILYHGPRNDLPKEYNPKKVTELLNAAKEEILCVRGNCDAEVDQMVLEFPVMAEYAFIYTEGLSIYATHGHTYHLENMPPLKKGTILLHGHTHVQAMEKAGDFWYLNPGSVSIPKENNENSYMVLEENTFIIKNLDGKEIKRLTIEKER